MSTERPRPTDTTAISDYLAEDEIRQLTQKQRRSSQSKILTFLGIEHKKRPDGTLVVLRHHVDAVLSGQADAPRPARKTGPRLDLIY
jgi:hypothetical protein